MSRAMLLSATALSTLSALVVACSSRWEDTEASGDNLEASALMCVDLPAARSYPLFDGAKLEARREDESVDVNRARFKPFSVMADEYTRALGLVPPSLAAAAATFEEPLPRWHSEPAPSAVALDAIYAIGLEGCNAAVGNDPSSVIAPTQETATTFCTGLMERAWGEAPADSIATCVDLAIDKLGMEPDPRTRWAHVCASILSAPQFLTF